MSNLIKAKYTTSNLDKKVIRHRTLSFLNENENLNEQQPRLEEFYSQAEKIITDAKSEAKMIKQRAHEDYDNLLVNIEEAKKAWELEKEHLIEEAKSSGYQAGFQIGKDEGYNSFQEQINLGKEFVAKAKMEAKDYVEASEKTILQLAFKLAEQILKIKLNENEELFLNLVKQVLLEAKEHHNIQIYVHPSKYHLVTNNKEELLTINNREKNILIYPDDELSEDSCILESSFGRIDASLDSQLTELKTKLLDLLEEE